MMRLLLFLPLYCIFLCTGSLNAADSPYSEINELIQYALTHRILSLTYFKLGQYYQYTLCPSLSTIKVEAVIQNPTEQCLSIITSSTIASITSPCMCALLCYQQAKIVYNHEIDSFNYIGMLNDLGLMYFYLGDYESSIAVYDEAIANNPVGSFAIVNLASLEKDLNHIDRCKELLSYASSVFNTSHFGQETYGKIMHSIGSIYYRIGDKKNAAVSYRLSYDVGLNYMSLASIAYIDCFKGTAEMIEKAQHLLSDALQHARKGNNGKNFLILLFAKLTSVIPIINMSTDEMHKYRDTFIDNVSTMLNSINDGVKGLVDPTDLNGGCVSLGYYLIYHGYEDLYVRQLLGRLYYQLASSYLILPTTSKNINDYCSNYQRMHATGSKIKVGFLSAFFNHHSVGLLLRGVIKHLSRDEFDVKLILSSTSVLHDYSTDDLIHYVGIDNVYELVGSLYDKRQQVMSLQLDVLVFGEIGMSEDSYYLSFYNIACKTVVFWGHAITSGITGVHLSLDSSGTSESDNDMLVGPDYYVSSVLFEHNNGRFAQYEYSERLLLMEGLTTFFERPPQPYTSEELYQVLSASNTFTEGRDAAGGSSRHSKRDFLLYLNPSLSKVLPAAGDSCVIFGVPQTLFKLHADFDSILYSILSSHSHFYVCFIESGLESEVTTSIIRRLQGSLKHTFQQVIFLRYMSSRDYITLCSMLDLVLDPFPVGGGRSSLEILSVGTPILVLYNRTSILQLTTAMYKVMGIDFNDKCCVSYNSTEYINMAVAIATNQSLLADVRAKILEHNSRLYENHTVIDEWQQMLKYVHNHPRPVPKYHTYKDIHYDTDTAVAHNWRKEEFCLAMFTYNMPPIYISTTYGNVGRRKRFRFFQDFNQVAIAFDIDHPHHWMEECVQKLYSQHRYHSNDKLKILAMCTIVGKQTIRSSNNVMYELTIQGVDVIANSAIDTLRVYEHDDLGCVMHEYLASLEDVGLVGAATYMSAITDHLHRNAYSCASMGSVASVQYRHNVSRGFLLYVMSNDIVSGFDTIPVAATAASAAVTGDTRSVSGNATDRKPITIALTSCRRVNHFYRTMDSLIRHLFHSDSDSIGSDPLVEEVLVVDDTSSDEDRQAMMRRYPFVRFIMKSYDSRKGHAASMNVLLASIKTSYLFYLEDDWEVLDQYGYSGYSAAADSARDGNGSSIVNRSIRETLMSSLAVLGYDSDIIRRDVRSDGDREKIHQVLFNSQISRPCAEGDVGTCDIERMDKGGWSRIVSYSLHVDSDVLAMPLVQEVEYCLHEFGLVHNDPYAAYCDREHDFTYWPSLSFNPSLWDLDSIKVSLDSVLGGANVHYFDEDDLLFEQRFSALCLLGNLHMAYLPQLLLKHIGSDISAYTLNNLHRDFAGPNA